MSVRFHAVPAPRHNPDDAAPRDDETASKPTERRGKRRPAIGGPIRQELGDDLKALVETWALGIGSSRAAAVRILLRRAVEHELNPAAQAVVVEGDELRGLLVQLQDTDIRRARFACGTGLTVQINDGPWTAPLGDLDCCAPHQEKS